MLDRACLGTVVAAGICLTSASHTASAQDFWAGKNLNLIVGSDPGTGYDVYGRAVGRHIAKHIPGRPTIVPQNLTGAGSKRAAEHIALVAPKDGTVIAIVFPGAIAEPLVVERAKWRYDPTKLEYLGTADSGTRMCSTRLGAKVTTFEQAKQEIATIGASAPGGSTFDYPTMLNALTGTKFKVVAGYNGLNAIDIAVDRGEAHGRSGSWGSIKATRPNWLTENLVAHIAVIGPEREPDLPSVPLITELAANDKDRAVLALISDNAMLGRSWLAPPGVPAERIAALREAFHKALHDPELMKEAKARELDVRPVSWQKLTDVVTRTMDTDDATVERLKRILDVK